MKYRQSVSVDEKKGKTIETLVHLVRRAFKPPHVHIFSFLLVLKREKSKKTMLRIFQAKETHNINENLMFQLTHNELVFVRLFLLSFIGCCSLLPGKSHAHRPTNQHIYAEFQFDYLFINIYYLTAACWPLHVTVQRITPCLTWV